ncbi:MAG: hypothetical protein H0U16_05750 [Actinobacteria bacterium]|nr:hypothetical protein [Actinomycetota bacterium]
MRTLLTYLPAVACAGMMLMVCLPMILGRKSHPRDDEAATRQEVATLREEIVRLKAERARETDKELLDG